LIKTFLISLLCVFAAAFLTFLGAIFISAAWHPDDIAVPFGIRATLGITLISLGILGWCWILSYLWDAARSIELPDNKADCPLVMHSRYTKEAHRMLAQHLLENGHSTDSDPPDVCGQAYIKCKACKGVGNDGEDEGVIIASPCELCNGEGFVDPERRCTDDEHPNQDEINFFNDSPPGSV